MDDINVLICDDSALMRNLISRVINNAPGLNVVGTAMNGQFLLDKIPLLNPDVIVLDIEMPVMTGVEFLRERKARNINIPVIILSSIAEKGASVTMECLELGAADFITKPNGSVSADINSVADRLVELVSSYGGQFARRKGKATLGSDYYSRLTHERNVARKLEEVMGEKKAQEFLQAEKERRSLEPTPEESPFASLTKKDKTPSMVVPVRPEGKIEIIAIGISTGGPNALREVFAAINPAIKQPILVVQHMPEGFTREFAASLNRICPLQVKEAEDGEKLQSGTIYIAPGNYHILVENQLGGNIVRLSQEPLRNGHRPSADVLFESVAKVYANRALGVIMTGMGKDGACQLTEMRKQGAWTLGQDEKTAIVYGMPKVAYEMGGVQRQVSLENMAAEISKMALEKA